MSLPAHLRAALDQLGRRGDNKGREAARCAGEEDFRERVGSTGRVAEECERAVVCHEE